MVQGKAVLLSIRPEWCDLILRGKKTMEVRKNYPKHLYEKGKPFKVYIYCTKAPQQLITIFKDGEETMDGEIHHGKPVFVKFDKLLPDSVRGKTQMVVGEFVCDKIYEVAPLNHTPDDFEQQACMDRDQIWEYLHGQGWAWHISELKIYGSHYAYATDINGTRQYVEFTRVNDVYLLLSVKVTSAGGLDDDFEARIKSLLMEEILSAGTSVRLQKFIRPIMENVSGVDYIEIRGLLSERPDIEGVEDSAMLTGVVPVSINQQPVVTMNGIRVVKA